MPRLLEAANGRGGCLWALMSADVPPALSFVRFVQCGQPRARRIVNAYLEKRNAHKLLRISVVTSQGEQLLVDGKLNHGLTYTF